MDAAATTESDTKKALQTARDLAVLQATLLVEFDDGGLDIRSQLSGGTKSVGGLQGMAALNVALALTALPDMDVELPVDGFTRDLHLELLSDVGFVERSAAVGAELWQRCLVGLIDLFVGGRLAVGLGAVIFSGLAAGLLGLAGGLTFGEGSGLALAGAGGLVELAAEALVLGLQVMEASLKGLAAGTRDGLYTLIIGAVPAAAARPRSRNRD